MRILIIFILLFTFNTSFSQKATVVDSIEISIEKAKIPSGFSNTLLRRVSFDETKLKYIMVKCKIKSTGKNLAEISAFSLLDTVNKIRYRVGDYLGYAGVIGFPEMNPYRKTESNRKSAFSQPEYDTTKIDFFDKYNFEGYTNYGLPIEFGTKKNPDQSIIYFGKTIYKNFKAELFFITLLDKKNSVFELYYKNSKIGSFELDSNQLN